MRSPWASKTDAATFVVCLASLIASAYLLPWWATPMIGALCAFSRLQSATIAALSATGWTIAILTQDAAASFRVSFRVAQVMGLPSGLFVYAFTALAAGLMSYLAVRLVRSFSSKAESSVKA